MDRLSETANSTTDPLARQGAFETYTALITEVGHPVEPFVALVLATILDKCSDKVTTPRRTGYASCLPVWERLAVKHGAEYVLKVWPC